MRFFSLSKKLVYNLIDSCLINNVKRCTNENQIKNDKQLFVVQYMKHDKN